MIDEGTAEELSKRKITTKKLRRVSVLKGKPFKCIKVLFFRL